MSEKLGMDFNAVAPSKTIKELCGGKSALQNEILGDLAGEFKAEPERAEEQPLSELGAKFNANYKARATSISAPDAGTLCWSLQGHGKIMSALATRSIQRAMPGGYGVSSWQLLLCID